MLNIFRIPAQRKRWGWLWAASLGLAAGSVAYAENGPPPGQVVIKIDPVKDLVSTTPDWSRTVTKLGPHGTTGCMERHIEHKPPLPLKPFTVKEVTDMARSARRLTIVRTAAGPIPMVRAAGEKLVPVATYAAQLTDMEKFLNIFGRSLRERGRDLGTVAELRNANIHNPTLPGGCRLKVNQYEPVWRNPRTPIDELVKDWKLDDEVPGWLTNVEDLRRLYNPRMRPDPVGGRSTTARGITGDEGALKRLQDRRALLTINASEMAGPAVQPAQRLKGSSIFNANRTGPLRPLIEMRPGRSAGSLSFLVDGKPSTTTTLQGNCENVIDFGSKNEGISLNGPGGSSGGGTGTQHNGAPFVKTVGEPSACLNDGKFSLSMQQPWKGCITTGGSLNNWFGGASCVKISSQNTGNDGVMAFEDTVDMGATLTVFGVDIELLGVHASAGSSTQGGASQPKPTVSGLIATAGGGTTCCEPIPGPSMYIPIGLTGLLVTSALDVKLNAGDMKSAAAPTPTGCAAVPVAVASVDGTATAKADARFEASISVLIASAGIGGQIGLVGGELTGAIATTADMGNNLVTVQPQMSFVSDIGSGQVYAFVDVDMLVYSKRWSITLAQWEAYKTKQDFPHETGTVRASKAATQTATCAPAAS